jgi:hypothetical protein
VVLVHEGAGAVVDGLARDGHVVGVHHAVDEAHRHPVGDEPGLPLGHGAQEPHGALDAWIVAFEDVVGEGGQSLHVLTGVEVLERAHADVAGGHAGEDRAGVGALAPDRLAGGDRRQRAGGGNAHRVHGLGDHELAQHGANPGAAVAHAGEGGAAGALELDVAAASLPVHDLAQEDRAAVAELGVPAAELVARIGLRERLGAFGDGVAREHRHALGRGQRGGVEGELPRQRLVEGEEAGRGDGDRRLADEEAVRQAGVAVVEGNVQGHGTDMGLSASRTKRAGQGVSPTQRLARAARSVGLAVMLGGLRPATWRLRRTGGLKPALVSWLCAMWRVADGTPPRPWV